MRTTTFAAFTLAAAIWLTAFPASIAGQGGGQKVDLPDGAGKEVAQSTCAKCHGLNMITGSSGNTRQGWTELIASMIALPNDQRDTVVGYLSTHFPTKPAPESVLIKGPVNVGIKEWMVPSLGSRPHDPLAGSDGSIWWTGQFANVLGRLDPKTNAMKEFPLKVPNSGPHGLTEDASG